MIVCSCNVLSDGDVKACLRAGPDCPRTPAQVIVRLGCSPNCGRCVRTIRSIMEQALADGRFLEYGVMTVTGPSEGLILMIIMIKFLLIVTSPCMIEGNGNCMITRDADALRYCKTFGDGQ